MHLVLVCSSAVRSLGLEQPVCDIAKDLFPSTTQQHATISNKYIQQVGQVGQPFSRLLTVRGHQAEAHGLLSF